MAGLIRYVDDDLQILRFDGKISYKYSLNLFFLALKQSQEEQE